MVGQVLPSKLGFDAGEIGGDAEEGAFSDAGESFNAGEGVFAGVDLPKATTVCLYSGLTMSKVGKRKTKLKVGWRISQSDKK